MNIFYRCIICACLKIKSFFLHSTLACRSALRRKHKEEMSMNASRPHHLPVLQKEHEQEMHVNYSILFIFFLHCVLRCSLLFHAIYWFEKSELHYQDFSCQILEMCTFKAARWLLSNDDDLLSRPITVIHLINKSWVRSVFMIQIFQTWTLTID